MLVGCKGRVAPAIGGLREITVVSDWWGAVEPTVREILQQRIPTPQPEPEFRLRVFTPDQVAVYSMLRTLFIIGTTDDSVVRAVLGPRVDSLPAGDYGLFKIPNAWAKNQELVVFAARDEQMLVAGLETYAGRLRSTFRDIALKHVARAVYHRGHNREAEEKLSREHSFTLDIPKAWHLKSKHADSGFIHLFGHYPDRGVFVYWENRTRHLTADQLVQLRDSLTASYYDGDVVEPDYVVSDTVALLSTPALKLRGIWQNEEETIGGPFVCYAFNHEGRFFLLDGYVYNPGKKKLGQLLHVDAIIHTFTPQ